LSQYHYWVLRNLPVPATGANAPDKSGPLRPELLGFASDGVYHASDVTIRAVSSYLTFSPLPAHLRCGAVCFLWYFPPAPMVRAFRLGSILPCEARTFLSHGATIRLPHRVLYPHVLKMSIMQGKPNSM